MAIIGRAQWRFDDSHAPEVIYGRANILTIGPLTFVRDIISNYGPTSSDLSLNTITLRVQRMSQPLPAETVNIDSSQHRNEWPNCMHKFHFQTNEN